MNETTTGTPGADGAAAGTGGTPVDGAAPAIAPAAPVAGAEGAAPAAPETGKQRQARKQTGAQAAATRAAARKQDKPAGAEAGTPIPPAAATTGGRGSDGAAPATGDGGAANGDGGTAAAGAEGASTAPAGSTVTAPDDWPDDIKARFSALPDDQARAVTLDFYKDMHRQFTESTQAVAQFRKDNEALVRTVEAHGIEPAEAARVLELSAAFTKDPRKVLQQLAADAGVEVFFERPLPAGKLPEFKTAEEMSAYIQQQTLEAVRAEREAAESKAAEQAERERYKAQIRTELEHVRKTHGEPFAKAQTAVMERMVTPLSVEDAYALVTLPTLRQQADEAAQAKAELASVKAEMEAMRKRATQPPIGVNGAGKTNVDDARLSPAERAVRKASQRKHAAANA